MRPKLSVIFPHKNRHDLLDLTLAYWRQQRGLSRDEVELIVVDDGSAYLPADTCARHDALLLMGQPDPNRRNPSVPWNIGLRAAQGEVLACTHPEIIPGLDAGRFLYGACTGDRGMLEGIPVWLQGPQSQWDVHVNEITVKAPSDFDRLGRHAIRANISVFRLTPELQEYIHYPNDPDYLQRAPGFWTRTTEFGGHTNHEIRYRFRGYFWNNLYALRAEVWRWMNYHRESRDWGADDSDFQNRNPYLQIAYTFADLATAYHQYHGPEFRGGCDDFGKFTSLADARLLDLYPETAGDEMNLTRGPFWEGK